MQNVVNTAPCWPVSWQLYRVGWFYCWNCLPQSVALHNLGWLFSRYVLAWITSCILIFFHSSCRFLFASIFFFCVKCINIAKQQISCMLCSVIDLSLVLLRLCCILMSSVAVVLYFKIRNFIIPPDRHAQGCERLPNRNQNFSFCFQIHCSWETLFFTSVCGKETLEEGHIIWSKCCTHLRFFLWHICLQWHCYAYATKRRA